MEIERLGAPLGARVHGVDVRDVDPTTFAAIEAAFHEHHVLVFPEQTLEPEDQKAFASRFGKLVAHPYNAMEGHPEIIRLDNRGKRKDVNQHWHSDMPFNAQPPKLTMLYALQAPEIGGDTAFANQHLAYEELSDGLREVVDGLRAVNSAAGLAQLYRQDPREAPRAEHPVVRTHDATGRRGLYVCKAFTERFAGWRREESQPLLEYLFQHAVRPEFQARQRWHTRDLAMWDNRSVLHFAVHDHAEDVRLIHRLQVEGDTPA